MKKVIAELEKVEKELETLEAKRTMLRAEIIEEMQKENISKMETASGSYSICTRMVWAYSNAITKLREKVKIAELKEQKTGKASATESTYLRFSVARK